MSDAFPPWQSIGRIGVLGTGMAMPGPPLSTDALVTIMTDRFGFRRPRKAFAVASRLSIRNRHICRPFAERHEPARKGHSNPELAAAALRTALGEAGLSVTDIGYLIGHTTTPQQPLPGNIALVADLLGYGGPHIELRQACTGFANALMVGFGLIATGGKPVAIVGSETGSLFFDPAEMNDDSGQIVNMVQMGDGAGAIILGPPTEGNGSIEAAWFGAIGLGRAPAISRKHDAMRFHHDFSAIRNSGHLLFEAGRDAAMRRGYDLTDIDRIIPHQASGRIGELLCEHLGLSPGQPFVNADRCGNTGSAAIWMAFAALREQGLRPRDRVLVLGAEASKYMYGGLVYEHG